MPTSTAPHSLTPTAAPMAVDAADTAPLVARVKDHVRSTLVPNALGNDHDGVSAQTIAQLRQLGLLNHVAPVQFGGAGLDRYADRRLHELLAYGDLNVWLIWAQHAPSIARLTKLFYETGAAAAHPLIEPALRGNVLIGAALSDVRRFPTGNLVARRDGDGWLIDGTVSWFTGWGLNDVALLGAVEPDTKQVVLALVPIDHSFAATPLDLRAVGGSRTERVKVSAVLVPDRFVLSVQPFSKWQHGDIASSSNAGAQFFGLGRRILDELAGEADAAGVAAAWDPYFSALRARAYELADAALDSGDPDIHLDERLSLKARAGEALTTLSRALLVARAGRGLPADNTAQLHARSALFLQVQGQTRQVRAIQLSRIAEAVPTII